jgi:hypothetical protein
MEGNGEGIADLDGTRERESFDREKDRDRECG